MSKTEPASDSGRVQPYSAPIGSRPSIEWVPTAELSVDETYQRRTDNNASQRLIKSIAARFDWRLFGVLIVSRRPCGDLRVIDGQHRWSAAAMRGDIDQVPCCLSRFDTIEEEARFFVQANRSRKPMNRLDDFHAALAAADDEALEVRRLVTDAGLSISRSTSSAGWKPGEVAFTGSIVRSLRQHGAAVTSAALTNLAEAFPGERLDQGASIFSAMVSIFSNPPADFDPDLFFTALLTFSAAAWGDFVSNVRGGSSRTRAMHQAMLEAYGEVLAKEKAAA